MTIRRLRAVAALVMVVGVRWDAARSSAVAAARRTRSGSARAKDLHRRRAVAARDRRAEGRGGRHQGTEQGRSALLARAQRASGTGSGGRGRHDCASRARFPGEPLGPPGALAARRDRAAAEARRRAVVHGGTASAAASASGAAAEPPLRRRQPPPAGRHRARAPPVAAARRRARPAGPRASPADGPGRGSGAAGSGRPGFLRRSSPTPICGFRRSGACCRRIRTASFRC